MLTELIIVYFLFLYNELFNVEFFGDIGVDPLPVPDNLVHLLILHLLHLFQLGLVIDHDFLQLGGQFGCFGLRDLEFFV